MICTLDNAMYVSIAHKGTQQMAVPGRVLYIICSRKGAIWERPCTELALRATYRPDSPVNNPHTDPFQTSSKLGHPSYPTSRRWRTTFRSHQMP